MNWLSLIQLVPLTIIGIQQIHADSIAGATKKQLAMESLGLAGVVSSNLLTGANAQLASETAALASNMIDQFTTLFKNTSQFGFSPNVPATPALPTPNSPVAVVVTPSVLTVGK